MHSTKKNAVKKCSVKSRKAIHDAPKSPVTSSCAWMPMVAQFARMRTELTSSNPQDVITLPIQPSASGCSTLASKAVVDIRAIILRGLLICLLSSESSSITTFFSSTVSCIDGSSISCSGMSAIMPSVSAAPLPGFGRAAIPVAASAAASLSSFGFTTSKGIPSTSASPALRHLEGGALISEGKCSRVAVSDKASLHDSGSNLPKSVNMPPPWSNNSPLILLSSFGACTTDSAGAAARPETQSSNKAWVSRTTSPITSLCIASSFERREASTLSVKPWTSGKT
mmetsp:Transcript_83844/g.218284  ORF Transcript_83844/g.218284 Transcript_83844/m.218284 type:complete len:283 (+) Transcript_83844:1328-2176(+)